MNPPNSHPSNPIQKAAMVAQKGSKPTTPSNPPKRKEPTKQEETTTIPGSNPLEDSKIAVAVGAVAITGLSYHSFNAVDAF